MFHSQIGLTYKIEVFVAERFPCYSQFLYQESNMTFVPDEEQRTTKPPVDFIATLKEDLHVNAIIQDMVISDAFSIGKSLSFINQRSSTCIVLKDSLTSWLCYWEVLEKEKSSNIVYHIYKKRLFATQSISTHLKACQSVSRRLIASQGDSNFFKAIQVFDVSFSL